MQAQCTRATRPAVDFTQKADSVSASCGNRPHLLQKRNQLWVFVRPASYGNAAPKLRLVRAYYPNRDSVRVFRRMLAKLLAKHITHLNWTITAPTKKIQRSSSGERTYFMKDRSVTVKKESFDLVQYCRPQISVQTQSEGLSDGRINTIEDRVRTLSMHPRGAAFGKKAATSLREIEARLSLCTFQALG